MRRFSLLLASTTCALVAVTTASASGTVINSGPSRGGATARLSGAQEVPPADPDGSGQAGVNLDVALNRACYAVQVFNIAPATAAHIHQAPAGSNGPIVVDFIAPTLGGSGGCASPRANAPKDTIQNIINHPSQYYVNVHNAVYPGGAVRGQLG